MRAEWQVLSLGRRSKAFTHHNAPQQEQQLVEREQEQQSANSRIMRSSSSLLLPKLFCTYRGPSHIGYLLEVRTLRSDWWASCQGTEIGLIGGDA